MPARRCIALPLLTLLLLLGLTLAGQADRQPGDAPGSAGVPPARAGSPRSQEQAPAARHALLIGVPDYAQSGYPDLPGAQRDLTLVEEALRSRLGFASGEIRVLRNADASHSGIERVFADLAQAAGPADQVFNHYSGHGSLVTDYNDQEPTGMDQTLVQCR